MPTKDLLIGCICVYLGETDRDKSSRVNGLQMKPHVIIADSALTFLCVVEMSVQCKTDLEQYMHIQLMWDYLVPSVIGTSWFLVPPMPCVKQFENK